MKHERFWRFVMVAGTIALWAYCKATGCPVAGFLVFFGFLGFRAGRA